MLRGCGDMKRGANVSEEEERDVVEEEEMGGRRRDWVISGIGEEG